jgi:hypothetical protein
MKNIGQNVVSFFQLLLKLEIRAFKEKRDYFYIPLKNMYKMNE